MIAAVVKVAARDQGLVVVRGMRRGGGGEAWEWGLHGRWPARLLGGSARLDMSRGCGVSRSSRE
jgi:hypothetical protein